MILKLNTIHSNKGGESSLPIHTIHSHIISKGNTFKAYTIVNQINKLNGYTVIPIKQLKQWEEEMNTYRKEAAKKAYRELQKGYMKMLADQSYESV